MCNCVSDLEINKSDGTKGTSGPQPEAGASLDENYGMRARISPEVDRRPGGGLRDGLQ